MWLYILQVDKNIQFSSKGYSLKGNTELTSQKSEIVSEICLPTTPIIFLTVLVINLRHLLAKDGNEVNKVSFEEQLGSSWFVLVLKKKKTFYSGNWGNANMGH